MMKYSILLIIAWSLANLPDINANNLCNKSGTKVCEGKPHVACKKSSLQNVFASNDRQKLVDQLIKRYGDSIEFKWNSELEEIAESIGIRQVESFCVATQNDRIPIVITEKFDNSFSIRIIVDTIVKTFDQSIKSPIGIGCVTQQTKTNVDEYYIHCLILNDMDSPVNSETIADDHDNRSSDKLNHNIDVTNSGDVNGNNAMSGRSLEDDSNANNLRADDHDNRSSDKLNHNIDVTNSGDVNGNNAMSGRSLEDDSNANNLRADDHDNRSSDKLNHNIDVTNSGDVNGNNAMSGRSLEDDSNANNLIVYIMFGGLTIFVLVTISLLIAMYSYLAVVLENNSDKL